MQLITYIQYAQDLEQLDSRLCPEVILESFQTSRFGKTPLKETVALAAKARERGFRPVLEWDILQTQQDFVRTIALLAQQDLSVFSAIRVQDPGALQWLLENAPKMPIQLILETGNHNLLGLKKWVALAGKNLQRVVLSLELSKDKLSDYISQLDCEVELLGLGRILLFYTPRKLLAPQYFDHDDAKAKSYHQLPLEARGSSEESPHSGFPLLENQHGTFMFNTKDHSLLENLEELKDFGLNFVRVDLRFADFDLIAPVQNLLAFDQSTEAELIADIKQRYPAKVIRGYYNVNRTTRLFPKLKNSRIQKRDESFAAEVIDALKDSHIGLVAKNTKRPIKKGDSLRLLAPDGREKTIRVATMRDSNSEELEQAVDGQVFFIPWVSGMNVKTMAFWI